MFKPLLRQAQPSRALLGLTILLSLGGGLLTLAQAWYVSQTISRVFLDGQALGSVVYALAALLVVMILRAGAVFGSEVAAAHVAIQVKTDLRQALFAKLLALGPTYAQGERTGELTSTAVEGVEALDAYFSQYLPQLAVSTLVPLTVLLAVLRFDPLSALVLFLTAPLIPLFMILIGKAAEALTKQQVDLLSRLSAHFLDVLQGLTTLKQLSQSQAQAGVIGRFSDQYRLATMSVLRVAFLSALVLELLATISTAIVAVEVGLRLLYGRMEFQPALFILILAPEFYLPLRMLGQRFHAASAGMSAARRLFEVLAAPPSISPQTQPLEGLGPAAGDTQAPWFHSIDFRNVAYRYADDRPALADVSFTVQAGQTVALVGPSGAGKSTLASLLLRFIEPTGGEILVDGLPLHDLPAAPWRERIAWVPQSPHLFHDTIAANIRLACPDAALAEVEDAARQAHLHDFILSLPQGYDTVVGDRGTRLSGGQAQRLALARAFLKDAPILLLDEPTSQVDPELEAQLQDATARLMQGRTTVTIAHRLNTVYQADQIIVLDHGRVVETGTHTELVRQAGLYARMAASASPMGWSDAPVLPEVLIAFRATMGPL